ncbi:MAG: T9SS type A sorting domain-containing protein [Calditrichaeota bacterium]|nr:T9SS type A sorting domain-containing protein [Calditrichota bacterium]
MRFPKLPESLKTEKAALRLIRRNSATAEIRVSGDSSFTLNFPQNNLASVRLVGIDGKGRLYINFEFFVQQAPLRIRREIAVFNSKGEKLASLHVPVNSYTQIFRDTFLGDDGKLFQMISTEEGIEIIVWDLQPLLNAQNPPSIEYPQRFQKQQHYNLLIQPDSLETRIEKVADFEDYPQVLPQDALSTGDSYVQLYWNCSAENLTNGVVIDDNGYPVETPSWISVGENQKVPYKWGGFESIELFLNGIDILKYAGDKYTDKCCGTSTAVGVDCSGFVSRCWNLPKHYSTGMMDDALTLPYLNWDELEPADAVHKVGHVRLMVKHNGDGSLTVMEASGRDWRVSYRNYYYDDLTAYSPRYYVNRQGAPGNIPQPRLDLLTCSDQTLLNWSVAGQENIETLRLYTSENGADWDDGQNLPDDTTRYSQDIANGQVFYYRMSSISSDGSQKEGPFSDAYGAYRNDKKQKVLIVDGFDRTSATNGSWTKIYHNFAVTHGQALYANEIPFETVDNDAVLRHEVYLGDYGAVFWILGDESTHDGTFTKDEQELVKEYLQNGGKLFVSGSEIAWDLSWKGASYDHDFLNRFLKAEYKADDSGSYTVYGKTASPFEGLTLHFDNGTHGVYPVNYPDAIKTENGSSAALNYANGDIAAVYYEGLFPDGDKAGKLFYMGFPFETIYNESERNALMQKIVDFFDLNNLSLIAGDFANSPGNFILFGNAPNPFNSRTMIRFKIPAGGKVELKVMNVLGQSVFSESFFYSSAGSQKIAFSSDQAASGVYFYRLIYKGGKRAQIRKGKMLILK